MNSKSHRWQRAGKLLIVTLSLLAYVFIVWKLLRFEYWNSLTTQLKLSFHSIVLLFVSLFLWMANLLAEVKKWRALIRSYHPISLINAWRQVLAGTTTAMGSPARLAEMGGRMALLPKKVRMHAGVLTVVGGILQTIIICIGGYIALLFNDRYNFLQLFQSKLVWIAFSVLAIILVVFWLVQKHETTRYYYRIIKNLNLKTIAEVAIWTVVRYVIYLVQLLVWFKIFGVDYTYADMALSAAIYFMLITIIPSYFLVDIGIRGSVAIFVFSSFTQNTPLILITILAMWISNVVVPVIIGSIILWRQRSLKQNIS